MKYFQIIIYTSHIDRFDILRCCSFHLFSRYATHAVGIQYLITSSAQNLSKGVRKLRWPLFKGWTRPPSPFFSRNQAFIGMSSSVHHRARRCHHNVSCAPLISFEWWVDSSAGLLVKYRENSYSEEINLCRPMAAKMSRKKNKKRSTPRGRATPLSRYVHRSFTKKTQEKEDRGLP